MFKPIIDFFGNIIHFAMTDFAGFYITALISFWTSHLVASNWLNKYHPDRRFLLFRAMKLALPVSIIMGFLYCWARPVLAVIAGYDSSATVTGFILNILGEIQKSLNEVH